MANPAQEARIKAQQIWPGAAVDGRGRSWIRHQHPTELDRFILDSHIGPIHYGVADDVEIDTAWEPGELPDAPWLHKMVKAGYNVYAGPGTTDFDAGQIVQYVHPASGETVAFQPQQLQWANDLDQIEAIADPQQIGHTTIDDDAISWIGAYGAGLDFRWQAQTARLAKYLTIQSLAAIGSPPQFIIDGGNPVLRMPFIFQKSGDIDIYINDVLWNEKSNNPQTSTGDVEFRLAATGEPLWWFKQASAEDSSDNIESPIIQQRFRAQAQNLFVEVLVPWSWLETAIYPVIIDPTVDYQVGASADDGYETSNGTNAYGSVNFLVDNRDEHWGSRWTGVTIPDGATIDAATVDYACLTSTTDEPDIEFRFEDGLAPIAFTNTTDEIAGRTYTTAVVYLDNADMGIVSAGDFWSTVITLPEMKTIIQELVDSYDYSSGSSMVCVFRGVVGISPTRDAGVFTYDQDTAYGAKLHIEYTAAGATYPIPEALHAYRQRRT